MQQPSKSDWRTRLKRCAACRRTHPLSDFPRDPKRRSGLASSCRAARNASVRRRRSEWTEERRLAQTLRQLYGLSIEDYNRMRAEQGYCCAICGRPESENPAGGRYGGRPRLHVDHTHDEERRVRGLLCTPCNVMLGGAKDDPRSLRLGIEYLRRDALCAIEPIEVAS